MTAKEKAQELIEKFKDYVHGYIGSSMLSGYEYPEQIVRQAKRCALIVVDEMLSLGGSVGSDLSDSFYIYWQEVKKEIEKIN